MVKSIEDRELEIELASLNQFSNLGLAVMAAGIVLISINFEFVYAIPSQITGIVTIPHINTSTFNQIESILLSSDQHTINSLMRLSIIFLALGIVIFCLAFYWTKKLKKDNYYRY